MELSHSWCLLDTAHSCGRLLLWSPTITLLHKLHPGHEVKKNLSVWWMMAMSTTTLAYAGQTVWMPRRLMPMSGCPVPMPRLLWRVQTPLHTIYDDGPRWTVGPAVLDGSADLLGRYRPPNLHHHHSACGPGWTIGPAEWDGLAEPAGPCCPPLQQMDSAEPSARPDETACWAPAVRWSSLLTQHAEGARMYSRPHYHMPGLMLVWEGVLLHRTPASIIMTLAVGGAQMKRRPHHHMPSLLFLVVFHPSS